MAAAHLLEAGALHPLSQQRASPRRRLDAQAQSVLFDVGQKGNTNKLMPELLVDFITSLDGYGAAEGWPGWWGLEGPRPGVAERAARPKRDRPHGREHLPSHVRIRRRWHPGTDVLAGLNKVVFSKTLTEPLAWANTKLVARDAVEAVREMKSDGSSPMRTMGSLTVCRALLKAGLVDRFRVVVFPVITGKTGKERIYDGYPDVALEMKSSRTFDGRTQLLEYVPTLLAGPPAATESGGRNSE